MYVKKKDMVHSLTMKKYKFLFHKTIKKVELSTHQIENLDYQIQKRNYYL